MSEEENSSTPSTEPKAEQAVDGVKVNDGDEQYEVVRSSDLIELEKTAELHKVVRVVDKAFRPYILLDDIDGNRFWNPINGTKEYTIDTNEKFKKAQVLYKENPPTAEEVSNLREVVTAISVLCGYLELGEETAGNLLDNVIVKFSYELYKRVKDPNAKLEDLRENADLAVYINMTTCLIKSFLEIRDQVKASVEQAMNEQGVQNNTAD